MFRTSVRAGPGPRAVGDFGTAAAAISTLTRRSFENEKTQYSACIYAYRAAVRVLRKQETALLFKSTIYSL